MHQNNFLHLQIVFLSHFVTAMENWLTHSTFQDTVNKELNKQIMGKENRGPGGKKNQQIELSYDPSVPVLDPYQSK
jgi:hypothetical protein